MTRLRVIEDDAARTLLARIRPAWRAALGDRGRALAWTRESVHSWVRDGGRSAGPSVMNPCNPDEEIRKRKVAPAGLSQAQARAWGERQVPKIIRKVLGADALGTKEAGAHEPTTQQSRTISAPTPDVADEMTLAVFYAGRFEPARD